ncbi:hypothetical protein TIFTF001_021979 [Ficus carica]|uniref:Uncharacterized protein n=1 Tax=Ficus carica TaxID=3494 RepID=A0AA88AJ17_FICCA|nr:hypothetical protein TIFTF001_021979 [Ficus carica]
MVLDNHNDRNQQCRREPPTRVIHDLTGINIFELPPVGTRELPPCLPSAGVSAAPGGREEGEASEFTEKGRS